MRIALIIFHKNINRYPKAWIKLFLKSIRGQTHKQFTVFEIDYGGTKNQIYRGSKFYSKRMKTHAHGHNFLCYEAVKRGFDYVCNTNVDDAYHYRRIEMQHPYMEAGYDVISANHDEINEENVTIAHHIFSDKDIKYNFFTKDHNVFSHPVAVYSKNFIENSGMLIPEEIPKDDFLLWKRSYDKFTFIIVPHTLLFYRKHVQNISRKKVLKNVR